MDPAHAALVDNFCWPDPVPGPNAKAEEREDAEAKLGALVVTCKRIYEGAVELRMPFISGKDSMKNDYRMTGPQGPIKISVPPTLLITAMGKVHDVRRVPLGSVVAPGEDSKSSDPRRLLWVSGQEVVPGELGLPSVDFRKTYDFLGVFHRLVREGLIESAHDVSDGGWLVATAELLFGAAATAELELSIQDVRENEPPWAALFGEPATSFVLSVRAGDAATVLEAFRDFTALDVGRVTAAASGEPGTLEARVKVLRAGSDADVLCQLRAVWDISELERSYHGGGGTGS
jgi:phosphoribosylformylglycinamidine synthase